jgi:exodeoxyribonuclease-3
MRLLSWNVNGLRALAKRDFASWVRKESPDALCLQETKATVDQLPAEVKSIPGYHAYFCSGARGGYSGVALYAKREPLRIATGIGMGEEFDGEGRILIAQYPAFTLYNVYFPNGKASAERLAYKMAFYDAFLHHLDAQRAQGVPVVLCGDVNTAHKEIDLARPKANEAISGFLPQERAWMDKLVAHGFVDTFRLFNQEPGQYSWWDAKSRARDRNVGWRIDYFFVSQDLVDRVKTAYIMPDVTGSDHCPVGLDLDVPDA